MAFKFLDSVDSQIPWVRYIGDLNVARSTTLAGVRERELSRAGRAVGDEMRNDGHVVSVRTLPTTTAPYPVRFAFNGAMQGGFLVIHNRSLLVQVNVGGEIKNILFNPTDGPANSATPYYERLIERMPRTITDWFKPAPNQCEQQLRQFGLSCADIDIIAFDHFHTQDLRPLVGTRTIPARFPNAYLLAPKAEWEGWDSLSQIQRAWFVPDGKRDLNMSRIIVTDGDMHLGQGALLLRTPGHTTGNQTLFVNTDEGVYGCSENGTCADNWSPAASSINSVRRYARHMGVDVIVNSNTLELGADQFASMMLERAVVDRPKANREHFQMFASSEVGWSVIAPHIRPTLTFGSISHGDVVVVNRRSVVSEVIPHVKATSSGSLLH